MNKWRIAVLLFLAALLVFAGVRAEMAELTLTINNQDTEVSAQVYSVADFHVEMPAGTRCLWMKMCDSAGEMIDWVIYDESDGIHPENDDFEFSYRLRQGVESFAVKARSEEINWDQFENEYGRDPSRLTWSEWSNTVTVNMKDNGNATAATITGLPTSVARGKALTGQIKAMEDGQTLFRGMIVEKTGPDEDDVGEWYLGTGELDLEGTLPYNICLSTASLETGKYWFIAKTYGVGYLETNMFQYFTVTDPEDEAILTVPDTVVKDAGFSVGGHVEGADWITLFCESTDGKNRGMDPRDYDGAWFSDDWSISKGNCSGEYQFRMVGYFAKRDDQGNIIEDNGHAIIDDDKTVEIKKGITVTAKPGIDLSLSEVPQTLAASTSLTFTVKGLPSDWYGYWNVVIEDTNGKDWKEVYRREMGDKIPENAQFTVSNDDCEFEPGHVYRVSAYTDAYGQDSSWTEAFFLVTSAASENLKLKVNDTTTALTNQLIRDELNVVIESTNKNVTAFALYRGRNEWTYIYGDDVREGRAELHERLDSGNTIFMARETTEMLNWDAIDENDNRYFHETIKWGAFSNTVTVSFAEYEPAPVPTLTLDKTNVIRGVERVEMTIGVPKNVTQIYFDIHDENGNYRLGHYLEDDELAGELEEGKLNTSLASVYLEPGRYYVEAGAAAVGMDWNSVRKYFEVTEPNAPVFTVDAEDTVLTHEDFRVTGYCENADWFKILRECVSNPADTRDPESRGGEAFATGISLDGPGVWKVSIIAYKRNEEEEKDEVLWQSDPKTMIATAPYGYPTLPVITAPEICGTDENLVFTVKGLAGDGSQFWNVWVEDEDGNHDRIADWYERQMDVVSGGETFTIDKSKLQKEHRYNICVYISDVGYLDIDTRKTVLVTDAVNEESLTLEVREADKETFVTSIEEAQVRSKVFFRLTAPENVTGFVKYSGHDWDDWWEIDKENPAVTWEDTLDTDRTMYFVRAWKGNVDDLREMWENEDGINWDNENWGGLSNVVNVNVTSEGRVGEANFSLKLDAEGNIERGNLLEVSVTYFGQYAEEANIEIKKAENDDWILGMDILDLSVKTFELPTANLENGEYYVAINAAGVGYDWTQTRQYFTVTDSETVSGTVSFSTTKTEVKKNERFYVQGRYCPQEGEEVVQVELVRREGTDWVRMFDNSVWEDESMHADLEFDDPGTYELNLRITTKVGEEEKVWVEDDKWAHAQENEQSSDKTVTITVTAEQLNPFGISVEPVIVLADEGVTFKAMGPEQVKKGWWHIWVDDITEEADLPQWNRNETLVSSDGTYTIPADKLAIEHSYRIHLYVDAEGYNRIETEATFSVVKTIDNSIRMTINGQNSPVENPAYTDFTLQIEAPEGAQMVSIFDGDDWSLLYPEFNPDTRIAEVQIGAGMAPGVYHLLARVTFDPGFWEKFDIDEPWRWRYNEDITWDVVSEAFTLTVTAENELDSPDLDLHCDFEAGGITRGEPLEGVVRYKADQVLPDRIRVDVRDSNGDGGYYWKELYTDWSDEQGDDGTRYKAFTFQIPTANLRADDYRLEMEVVRANYAPAYASEVDKPFKVKEAAPGSIQFYVDTNRIKLGEAYTFTAYAPGAVKLKVVETYDENTNGNVWIYDGENCEDGSSFWDMRTNLKVTAYASYDNGVSWPTQSETFSITVAEPGQLTAPIVSVSKTILTKDDRITLTFTDPNEDVKADLYVIGVDTIFIHGEPEENVDGCFVRRDVYAPGTYKMDISWFRQKLKPGEVYLVSVDAYKEGYYSGQAGWNDDPEKRILVAVVDSEEMANLQLPAALGSIEADAFAGLGKQLVVLSGGKEGTEIKAGAFGTDETGDSLIAMEIPAGFVYDWRVFPHGDFTVVMETTGE